jgi:Domain of unknown function (DUF4332)
MNLDEIEGIGSTYSTTLQTRGLTTVDHLLEHGGSPSGRQALAEKSGIINEEKGLVRRLPSETEVESWIENAKTLPRVVHH